MVPRQTQSTAVHELNCNRSPFATPDAPPMWRDRARAAAVETREGRLARSSFDRDAVTVDRRDGGTSGKARDVVANPGRGDVALVGNSTADGLRGPGGVGGTEDALLGGACLHTPLQLPE